MTLDEFEKELVEKLIDKEEFKVSRENILLYHDGFAPKDNEKDKEFVRSTNIRYHKTESDILIGNYMVITMRKEGAVKDMSRFSIEYLLSMFEEKGWEEVWEIVRQNLELSSRVVNTGILEQVDNYEAVKESLIIRPINYTDHRYELKECVYKQIGDIALVLYLKIYDTPELGLGTVKMQRQVFEQWGRDKEEVWENAMLNTNVIAPPRIYYTPMECYEPEYAKGAFMALGSRMTIAFSQSPIVTTTKQTNGAIALFYPGVAKRLAQMAGSSFYVAFTSIHEAVIHCKGSKPPLTILRHLKNVKKSLQPDELLTRKVYYYDMEKDTFTAMEL